MWAYCYNGWLHTTFTSLRSGLNNAGILLAGCTNVQSEFGYKHDELRRHIVIMAGCTRRSESEIGFKQCGHIVIMADYTSRSRV